MAPTISTEELASKRIDPSVVIVDIRPMAAYNGWKLNGEARGGHIHGAVACPYQLAAKLETKELTDFLYSKAIVPYKTVVLADYRDGHSDEVAERLAELGYEDLLVYDPGMEAWASDPELPMDRLSRFDKLVHPKWVDALIHGKKPESYDNDSFAVFHITFGVPEEYEAGHIPGAFHLDTNSLESNEDWNRRSPEELEATLLSHGVRHDTTVIVYGRDSNPSMAMDHPGQKAGQIAATRVAAILMYAGVEDVRLLDGGLDAWMEAGYEIENETKTPTPIEEFGAPIPARPEYFVDLEEAKALLEDPEGALVSIRSWNEFIGETSGYHYITAKGRIAGAVWGNCGTDAYHMQNYRIDDSLMREYHEIEDNWRTMGITPNKRVAFYCGTGWRASETFFYAHVMGWPKIAVYDGGWLEWSSNEDNPIERGEPD